MKDYSQILHRLINEFLETKIDADIFERMFTDVFDFEYLELEESTMGYFRSIRKLLERYTFSENDLKNHPDYFIGSKTLREQIQSLRQDF